MHVCVLNTVYSDISICSEPYIMPPALKLTGMFRQVVVQPDTCVHTVCMHKKLKKKRKLASDPLEVYEMYFKVQNNNQ